MQTPLADLARQNVAPRRFLFVRPVDFWEVFAALWAAHQCGRCKCADNYPNKIAQEVDGEGPKAFRSLRNLLRLVPSERKLPGDTTEVACEQVQMLEPVSTS